MNKLIVGGFFGDKHFRESNVIKQLAISLGTLTVVNGGGVATLSHPTLKETINNADLTIWAPDVSNDEEKLYPTKKKGSFLVCSKVMRDGHGLDVAVSRIFKMHANAVIAIYKHEKSHTTFQLIDALGNMWIDTSDIQKLADAIMKMYEWSKSQIIASSIPLIKPFKDQEFLDIVKNISGKIEALNVGRFFGNCSTRYTSLFPFARINVKSTIGAYVSPGDIDKNEIRCEDMILANMPIGAGVYPFDYIGQKKPSADTPIHLTTYKQYPHINYVIHGHAYIQDAKYTREYYPCGDLREAEEISYFISGKSVSYFNLKNHGFIILANAVDDIDGLDITFTPKQIGELVS